MPSSTNSRAAVASFDKQAIIDIKGLVNNRRCRRMRESVPVERLPHLRRPTARRSDASRNLMGLGPAAGKRGRAPPGRLHRQLRRACEVSGVHAMGSARARRTLQLQVVVDVILPLVLLGTSVSFISRAERLAAQGFDSKSNGCRTCSIRLMFRRRHGSEGLPVGAVRWDIALENGSRAADAGCHVACAYRLHATSPHANDHRCAWCMHRLARIEGGAALQERLVDAFSSTTSRRAATSAMTPRWNVSPTSRHGRFERSIPHRRSTSRWYWLQTFAIWA